MECPACHVAQAADSSFCDQCGADLEPTCPKCGAANRVGARFCRKCRTNLSGDETAVPSKPTPVADAPPKPAPHLAARILNSAAALEGERKLVTVLFADVKGSMDLAEQMDAEEWSAIMQRFFRILSEGVERFEGFVDKFTGDGIMALFGAPIAHEDHARRACYAALHLRENLKRYADELRRTTGLSFSVRMGLNSGEVVVGKIGDDLRMDYTAQGHTVGLAQRMEQRAAADSAYLTEHTAALVKGYFDLRDLGRFDLKGASAPIGGFELLGVGAHRTRLDRSRERGFSRLVGRAGELGTLEASLDRALQGRGGAVGVVAEAGVGKSRLCMEFVERCRARGVAVYDTHCPSHGQAVPLLPIFDLFRGFFGVTSRDSDQAVREKIAGRVVLLDRALQDFLPLAFDFLGVADPAQPVAALEPAVRQRQLIAFTRLLVQSRSVREPAVLFVDDAHWIDSSSDAFLAEVAEIVPGTRTMLLLNFRPEYSAEWMARPSYQQLPLHPLGSEALDELLDELLGGDSSVQTLRGLIRERSGGNPFFIEEMVQALCESGKLVGEPGARRLARPLDGLDLPPTVQGILAGRIDRLCEREKTLLQTAAVIGRKFSASLLLRVSGLSEAEFEETVATLRHAEFLQEESLYPDVEYAFRHPLTHEVAEGSQLSVQRRRVHLAVARVLEELHADKPGEHSALLAHHWDLGGEAEPATRWHQRAAEWIAGSNASEARRHWERVRDLAEKMENPELALPLGQRSRLMLLEYAWRFGVSSEEADEMLREGEDWARRHHREQSLAAFYNAFAMPCAFSGNPRRARELATEGLRLAEQAGDGVLACALELRLFFVAQAQGLVAEMAAAMVAVLRHGDEDQRRASPLVGYDVPSTVAGYRGAVYVLAGQLHSAPEHIRRGLEMSRACEAPEVESWMHWVESDLWCESGEAARALASARQSNEIAERIDNPLSLSLALACLGRALLLSGDATSAIEVLTRADAVLDRVHRLFQVGVVADLARAYCAAGDLAEAKTVAQRSLAMAEQRGAFEGEVRARFALATALMLQGGEASCAEALTLLDVAQSRAEQIGLGVIAPHLTELRGEIARRRGDHVVAEAAFEQAGNVFQEMGATGHVRRLAERPGGERPGR